MKRTSFTAFITNYAKEMLDSNTLRLIKLEKESTSNQRLKSLMALYLMLDEGKINTLFNNKHHLKNLYQEYLKTTNKYVSLNVNQLDDTVKELNAFDFLRKAYDSYQKRGYNKVLKQKEYYYMHIKEDIKKKI